MTRLPIVLPLTLALTACASAPAAMAPGAAPGTELGAHRVEMLVATTRRGSPDTNVGFSGERADAISLQRVVVSVPPDAGRTVGQIQWPTKAPGNPATDFVTRETTPIASDRQAIEWFCCDPRISVHLTLESGPLRGPDDEAIEVHGRADHRRAA